jgi:hypothetical protein
MAYQIERRIDQFSVPASWDPLKICATPEEVTGYLLLPLTMDDYGRSTRVVEPNGDTWSRQDWLRANIPAAR